MSFFDSAKLAIANVAEFFGAQSTQYEYEDAVIRNILTNTVREQRTRPAIAEDNNVVINMLGTVASFTAFVKTEIGVQVLKNNLYLILSFITFTVLFSLPFVGLFGMFKFSAMMVPVVYFMTIKITPFIWSVVDYADNKLIEKMGLESTWSNMLIGNNDDLLQTQSSLVTEILIRPQE